MKIKNTTGRCLVSLFPRGVFAAMVIAVSLAVSSADALTIDFDYRFDTLGMFDAPERRAALEAAASVYDRFADNMNAIEPIGQDTWSVSLLRPDGKGNTTIDNFTVAEDSIKVFVGGWSFHPSVLGFAGQGSVDSVEGSDAWKQNVAVRGQLGALDDQPTDYGPWGGAITFNMNIDWHYDALTDPAGNKPDFLTTAMHELGHILGFGEAASWYGLVGGSSGEGYTFLGDHTVSILSEPAALDAYASHWAEGTMSVVDGAIQETAMDPSTPRGERQWMTDLDYAGFADIGWQVPEPVTAVLAMPLCGWLLTRRRKTQRDCLQNQTSHQHDRCQRH